MSLILIIEDDPVIQEGLGELLSLEHYNVEKAGDGRTGIQKAITSNPDLILLDINLPNIGGFEICRELRSKNFINPIIFLSSKSEQVDKIVGLEIGADDYITKPFDSRELLARVRANLRKTKKSESVFPRNEYEKQLCTIFFSDMYGYSEKMNRDEIKALDLLNVHNHILRTNIESYGGKIIELIGDAVLASFSSVSTAAECACIIQKTLSDRNLSFPEEEKIQVRIGLHLGEVFVFADNIKGDVLNIAARLQEKATPGSVYISSNVYDILKKDRNFRLQFVGSIKLKNIETPVDVYSAAAANLEKV